MKNPNRWILAQVAILSLGLMQTIAAQSIVSPADRGTLDGSGSTAYPLGRFNCRHQQLHQDLGTTAKTLVAHGYRRDAMTVRGTIAAFQSELEVRLSMSPKTPSTASRQFSDNAGTETVVLPRTRLSFPATDRPTQDPAPKFELLIPYQTTFAYPQGGGVLCVDVRTFGNQTPSGQDRNFLPYIDAHEQSLRSVTHRGFRSGTGCKAFGNSTAAYASFAMTRDANGLTLDVAARFGVPGGRSALLMGFGRSPRPWPLAPSCVWVPSQGDVYQLAGTNDARGHWNGKLTSAANLPIDVAFYAQILSGGATGVAASDTSRLVTPAAPPTILDVVRITNQSDGGATTGTVSATTAITQFAYR